MNADATDSGKVERSNKSVFDKEQQREQVTVDETGEGEGRGRGGGEVGSRLTPHDRYNTACDLHLFVLLCTYT